MKRLLLLFLIFSVSCKESVKEEVQVKIQEEEKAQTSTDVASSFNLKVYDYDGLKPLINKADDKTHVVNFWATWCAPCIKELPYFEKINEEYKDKNVEVLLVSLDFPRQYEKKLMPFIKKRNIKSEVVCFDDVDQNRWIPDINEDWSGALPATIIYKGDKRKFYERSFTQEELENELKQFLN